MSCIRLEFEWASWFRVREIGSIARGELSLGLSILADDACDTIAAHDTPGIACFRDGRHLGARQYQLAGFSTGRNQRRDRADARRIHRLREAVRNPMVRDALRPDTWQDTILRDAVQRGAARIEKTPG